MDPTHYSVVVMKYIYSSRLLFIYPKNHFSIQYIKVIYFLENGFVEAGVDR